jgi:hypothetical protein
VTIDWFRDLVIIIFGLVGTFFLVFIGIMAFSLFRRFEVILDSLKVTSANIQEISTVAKEQLTRPVSQVGSIFRGIVSWIKIIGNYFKKAKRELNDGE